MKNKIFSPYLTRRKKPTWTKHDYLKVYSETSKSSYTVMLHLFCLIALSSRGELTKEPLIDIITTLLLCVFSFDNLLLEGGVLWLWMMLLSNFLFLSLLIAREVDLQRDLSHEHVVGFHSYFEDEDNVYIVLENCSRKV